MRTNRPGQSASRGSGGPAFTMVELLVVLLILAILLGLVVGISRYIMAVSARRQTEAIQKLVMLAIDRYYETRNPKEHPPSDSNGCRTLMSTLMGNEAAKEALRDLSPDAWGGSGQPLKDGFGEEMKYFKDGGLGGKPVLVSKGSDRKENTPDDVRSDGQ